MWNDLGLIDKARMMQLAVKSGITDLRTIEEVYNTYASGGKIHIKPENRGKFTALKKRTGHSASWFKEHGTPAQKKMAVFALNARKWKHDDGGPLENEGGYTSSLSSRERINTLFDPSWGFGLEGAISRLVEGSNKSHGEENEYWRAYLGLPNEVPKMNSNARTEWDDAIEEEKLSRGELPSDFYGTTPRMDQMIQAVADTANTGRILRNYDYYKEQIPSLAEKYIIQHMYNQGKKVMENPNKWTQVTEGPQIYLYDKVGADTNEKAPLGMLADFGMMWSPDEGVLKVHDTYDFPNYVTTLSSIPKRPKEMKIRGKINYDPQKGSILLRDSIPDTQKVAPPVIIRKSE